MLTHIHISQFALIDNLDLDISDGFTVITGETGAGKSIIMGALGLIMGDRADSKSVRTGAAKSIVETVFRIDNDSLKPVFDAFGLDYQPECIVRREVTVAGKSRAFINDTPVTIEQLKSVTSHLIDIHSQYENLLLNNSDFQLNMVDSVAKISDELSVYKDIYSRYTQKVDELQILRRQAEEWREERDYAQFQFDQLSEADLIDDEQELLEAEMETLCHIEEIKTDIAAALSRFDDEQYGVLHHLKDVQHSVERAARYVKEVELVADRIASAFIELTDTERDLSHMFAALDFDPARKVWVEERLNTIYSLQQKHRVKTVVELIAVRDAFYNKLQRIDSFDTEISRLEREEQDLFVDLTDSARILTQKRTSVTDKIADYLTGKLIYLGMPNARIELHIVPLSKFTSSGIDEVRLLFSANKNADLRPIASIASGGEIARVMLSLKTLVANNSGLSTIIFDEIDTGVSGDIAQRMGEMMREISVGLQVITITHLPQIAARGEYHFKVYKEDDDQVTKTYIRLLSSVERENEIAEMLSGKNPTPAAICAAQELLVKS